MSDILSAIDARLRALAAGEVPAREKPCAHDHGLLRVARDEIARLRKPPIYYLKSDGIHQVPAVEACCTNDHNPCKAFSTKGFACTRPRNHAGEHIACSEDEHGVYRWPQQSESNDGKA